MAISAEGRIMAASYGKAIDDLLALPAEEFARGVAAYTWRTTPPEQRNGISLEDFIERVVANPLTGARFYSTMDAPCTHMGINRAK